MGKKRKRIEGFEGIFLLDPPDEPTFSGAPKNTNERLELSKRGLREMWPRLKGLPLRTEHYHVDIGQITHVWFKDGKAYCRFYLQDEPWTKGTLDKLKSGEFRSLSLKHDPETYIPLEMTLCQKPAREGCVLTKLPTSSSSASMDDAVPISSGKEEHRDEKNEELYKEPQSQYAQATPLLPLVMQQQQPQQPQQQQQQQQQQPLVAASMQSIPALPIAQAAMMGQALPLPQGPADQMLPMLNGGRGFALGNLPVQGQAQPQQQYTQQPVPQQQQQQQQQQTPATEANEDKKNKSKKKRGRGESDEEGDSGEENSRDKEKSKLNNHRSRAVIDVQRLLGDLQEKGKLDNKTAARAKKVIRDLRNSAKTAQKEHEEMKDALLKTEAQSFHLLKHFGQQNGQKFNKDDERDFAQLATFPAGRRYLAGPHQKLVAASQASLRHSRRSFVDSDSDDASVISESDRGSSDADLNSNSDSESEPDSESDSEQRRRSSSNSNRKEQHRRRTSNKLRDTGDSSHHRNGKKKEKEREKKKQKKQKKDKEETQTQPPAPQAQQTVPQQQMSAPVASQQGLVQASAAIQGALTDLLGTSNFDNLPAYTGKIDPVPREEGHWGAPLEKLLGGGGTSSSSYTPGPPPAVPTQLPPPARGLVSASSGSAEQQSQNMGWQNNVQGNPMLLSLYGNRNPLVL